MYIHHRISTLKMKIYLPLRNENISPQKIFVQRIFIAALFMRAPNWKPHKGPSIKGELIQCAHVQQSATQWPKKNERVNMNKPQKHSFG